MQNLAWIITGISLVLVLVSFSFLFILRTRLSSSSVSSLDDSATRIALLQQQLEQTQTLLKQQEEENQQLIEALAQLREQYQISKDTLVTTKAEFNAQIKLNEGQIKQLKQSHTEFEDFLKNYTQVSLNQTSEQLNKNNQQQLDVLLSPLKQQLKDFRERVDHVHQQDSVDRRGLKEQIFQLKDLNQKLSSDAVNLANALRGDNKIQGNWGEMILEKVLEQSGLRKDYEYHTQPKLTPNELENSSRLHPDVIVHLPDNKDVIIDAKVSLVAYERYHNTTDEGQQKEALAAHIQSLKQHINNLSSKAYESAQGVRSLDYVLLFIPVESAYMLALQSDKGESLFIEAMQRNIMLVSPATLLMAMRTIHNIWRYEHQTQNAQEIARQAENLYKKLVSFTESMEGVGVQLNRAQQSYETAFSQLSTGRGNSISIAQKMIQLGGIKPKKSFNDDLVDKAQSSAELKSSIEDTYIKQAGTDDQSSST